jgi:hypothetical protein
LVATSTNHVSFAGAFTSYLITTSVVDCSKSVATASFTAIRIVHIAIPEASFAPVTSPAIHVPSTDASTSNQIIDRICSAFTFTVVFRTDWVTVTWLTNVWVPDITLRVLVESWSAFLAVLTHCVVSTIVTDSTGGVSRGNVDRLVEVASRGMTIAFTSFASMGHAPNGRTPRKVVVEILAFFAVHAFCVVLTIAFTIDHVSPVHLLVIQWNAPRSMTIAGTRTPDNHVIDGIIILFVDLSSGIQKVIPEGVQFSEGDAKIGHSQQFLDFFRVWIINLNVGTEDSEDDFTVGRWRNIRVTRLANHLSNTALWPSWYTPERIVTVIGKVSVDFPRFSIVIGSFDVESCRSERFEGHDEMREMELCLEVKLDRDILFAILRLPPRLSPVIEGADDILDLVTVFVEANLERVAGITHEALLLILQVGHDAIPRRTIKTTGRRG